MTCYVPVTGVAQSLSERSFFERGSLAVEHLAIVCAGMAGLAGVSWPAAAITGAIVYLLIELSMRNAPALQHLSHSQIASWRKIAGTAFVGAGHCCLGWSIGLGIRAFFLA